MPIPVLFLIQHLHQGGTEGHFRDLVTGLDRGVIEPHVIHFNHPEGNIAKLLAAQAWLPITSIPVTKAYNASGFKAAWQVRRYLRRHSITAVVTFHFVADFIGTLAAWGTGVKVVSSRRDMGFTRTPRQLSVGRHLARGVARYIAVSDAVRQAVARDERVDPSRIEVIYNGIDLDELDARSWDLAAERAKWGIASDELIIGCIANFNPIKDHLTLLEAFVRLGSLCPGIRPRLLLAGDGPMEPAIRSRIAELGIGPRVILAGNSREVEREFQLADLIVLPSISEGFSNSIVQAMALEKPVVACRVGGNPEAIVEGVTGLMVEPKNPAAMAQAMAALANNPALRRQMGESARARARACFAKRTMLDKYRDLLLRVTGKG